MDNVKTGNLIRELRKEKDMTQKDLAEKLCITDRAVSKWERGICAPDISLLEPLSKVLDTTVIDLISGERTDNKETESIELSATKIIEYSKNDTARKIKKVKRNTIVGFIVVFVVLTILIPTVGTICGEGFSWECIPAYIAAQKGANALENCDKQAIEENIANGENIYDGLVRLEAQHVYIHDTRVNLSRVKLDDRFLLLEINFEINYRDIKYIFTCYGTYKNGKVELMRIISPNVYDEYPKWILELNDVLRTYNPG